MGTTTDRILSAVQRNVGPLTGLMFHRRLVNNEIDTVRRLAGLVEEHSGQKSNVSLRDGQWSIEPASSDPTTIIKSPSSILVDESEDFNARTLNQMFARHSIEQENLEKISGYALVESLTAADEGNAAEGAPEVNRTWENHFFSHAKLISRDDVQQFWGRILHGELRQPGSFSIRTLQTLASMSNSEANVFQTLAKRRLQSLHSESNPEPFMLYHSSDNEQWPINYIDVLTLKSAGLLSVGDTTSLTIPTAVSIGNEVAAIAFHFGGKVIIAKRPQDDLERHITMTPFTTAGWELSSLVEPKFDPQVKLPLSKWEELYNWEISVAPLRKHKGKTIVIDDEKEVRLEEL